MSINEIISRDINIPISLIEEAKKYAHIHIKKFPLKKRKGGYRVISQPSAKLKTVQYWLIHNIFKLLQQHPAAVAYRQNISTLDNAKAHKKNKYFLKMDLKDFFPSITYKDFIPFVRDWHKSASVEWKLDKSSSDLIKVACFSKEGTLPIGYPSSPIISNIVMYHFDTAVVKLTENVSKYGKVVYTRYADDLVLSTNIRGACKVLLKDMEHLITKTKTPNIIINKEKTVTLSSSSGSAIVTGLRVTSNSHITIHRKQKDHIRLLLSLLRKNNLEQNEYTSLLGHLSYVRHVDPRFYTKIQKKHFKEIYNLKQEIYNKDHFS